MNEVEILFRYDDGSKRAEKYITSSFVPRISEEVTLPNFPIFGTLVVSNVVWDFDSQPSVTIYLVKDNWR